MDKFHQIRVSIIIPCRNEERFIDKCLGSIVANDYSKNEIEVLIIDGMSDDNTREVITEYLKKYSYIKLFNNKKRIVSSALNKGIQKSKGNIIIIMGVHIRYSKDYISKCVKYLQENDAEIIGGICITLPENNSLVAKAIAFALAHPFGVGNSYFRIGLNKPQYVDTVPFGCYKREIFNKIGLFDEDLVRNQDDELNARLRKSGGKILLFPDIVSYYYARGSLKKLWRMYFQYGYFKPLAVKKIGYIFTIRQLVPGILVGALIILSIFSIFFKVFFWVFFCLLGFYIITNFGFSLKISFKEGFKFFFILPFCFAAMHFSYGIGYLKGIIDFLLLKKYKSKNLRNISLSR